MALASRPLQGAPEPLHSALGLTIPAEERVLVRPAQCPGLTLVSGQPRCGTARGAPSELGGPREGRARVRAAEARRGRSM